MILFRISIRRRVIHDFANHDRRQSEQRFAVVLASPGVGTSKNVNFAKCRKSIRNIGHDLRRVSCGAEFVNDVVPNGHSKDAQIFTARSQPEVRM